MIIGQEQLRERLRSMVRWNKLPKFIILTGEVGSGRKTIAKWLAEEINAQCVEVPTSVADIRKMVEDSYKLGSQTLYLIADGDKMSGASKSALLKVTEEPPKYARFVLTATDKEQILDTIASRACILPMESYTMAELMEFAGDDTDNAEIYTSCCNNAREVELVKHYNPKEFYEFVQLVVDNIAEVAGCNALKMENRIAFKAEDKGYDMKIFLQAFRTECMKRLLKVEDAEVAKMYSSWIQVTSEKLRELNIQSINKQSVFDMWIFDIREAVG